MLRNVIYTFEKNLKEQICILEGEIKIEDSKESIITTSDTEEEVKQFVNYLEKGNVDRDIGYSYEEVKFVKKLKKD